MVRSSKEPRYAIRPLERDVLKVQRPDTNGLSRFGDSYVAALQERHRRARFPLSEYLDDPVFQQLESGSKDPRLRGQCIDLIQKARRKAETAFRCALSFKRAAWIRAVAVVELLESTPSCGTFFWLGEKRIHVEPEWISLCADSDLDRRSVIRAIALKLQCRRPKSLQEREFVSELFCSDFECLIEYANLTSNPREAHRIDPIDRVHAVLDPENFSKQIALTIDPNFGESLDEFYVRGIWAFESRLNDRWKNPIIYAMKLIRLCALACTLVGLREMFCDLRERVSRLAPHPDRPPDSIHSETFQHAITQRFRACT